MSVVHVYLRVAFKDEPNRCWTKFRPTVKAWDRLAAALVDDRISCRHSAPTFFRNPSHKMFKNICTNLAQHLQRLERM